MNGRPRRMTLGLYGDLTVKQARTLAQEKAGDKNAELGDKAGVLWSTDS
jgi:predicted Zn-dependent peptidase